MRFPKLRYSLGTLLLVMTAIAVLLWAVPAWREYRYRREFEHSLSRLNLATYSGFPDFLSGDKVGFDLTNFAHPLVTYDQGRNRQYFLPFEHGNDWYVIWGQYDEITTWTSPGPIVGTKERWTQLRVYRLEPAPRSYAAQTASVKKAMKQAAKRREATPDARRQYLSDFCALISGHEIFEFSGSFALIHADPPFASDE